jgi:hypothetical protein
MRRRRESQREPEPLPTATVLPFEAPLKSAHLRLVVDNTREAELARECREELRGILDERIKLVPHESERYLWAEYSLEMPH